MATRVSLRWRKIWEELHLLVSKEILVEVQHVKARRTRRIRRRCHFEKSVTEGNEKADELAKAGAMLDEGFMAETRASSARARRGVLGLAVRSKLLLFGRRMERL